MKLQNGKNQGNRFALLDNTSVKVVVIGCIAIIAALLCMSVTTLMIMNNAVVGKLKTSDLENLAESIGAVIEGKIDRAVDASIMLANDPMTVSWVQNGETDEAQKQFVRSKMKDTAESFGYDTTFLVGNETKHYWSYHDGIFELLDTVSEDDPYDIWFFNILQMNKKYEINIDYNKELNDTYVWINTLMGDTASPAGVTGIGMNLGEVIHELIRDEAESHIKNELWLVDGSGTIYLSKNPEHFEKNIRDCLPIELTAGMDDTGTSDRMFTIAEYRNKNGEIYDIAYKSIRSTNWKLMIQIPRSESIGYLKAVTINTVISCIVIILLMVATFYILSSRIANPYKRAVQLNQELERIVAERTRELQDKNTKIMDSIEYAKKIQQAILPSGHTLRKSLADVFTLYEPRDIVGGDFYWMRTTREGFLLVVGDCTGHGVPGALMTMAVNAMLGHIADEPGQSNPAVMLEHLDRLIRQTFRKEESDEGISDGLDAAILLVSHGKALFSGANLSIYVDDGTTLREIKGSTRTIDCTPGKTAKSFENIEIPFSADTLFYIPTDGYQDQVGGEQQLPFGKKRMITLFRSIRGLPMEEKKKQLESALKEYQGNEIRRDDITLLGFRI